MFLFKACDVEKASSAPRGSTGPIIARLLAAGSACGLAAWGICGVLARKHLGHIPAVPVKVHILAFALLALQAMPLEILGLPPTILPGELLLCTCGLCLHLALTFWVKGHIGCSDCPTAKDGEEASPRGARAGGADLEAFAGEDTAAAGVAWGKGPADEDGACDLGDSWSELSTAASEGSDAEFESELSGSEDDGRSFALEETTIIFDWDDTVLPSSWVEAQGLRLGDECVPTEWQRGQLAELSALAVDTLRVAQSLGTVVFVTNADEGWIEMTCQKFMPELWPAMRCVRLLSARAGYETPQNSARPAEWKVRAFEAELLRIYGGALASSVRRKNVMSIGDSRYEREALMRVTRGLPGARVKSVKLVDRPGIGQLRTQHSMLAGALEELVQRDGDLDLCVRCAPTDA